ncbi:hypothetical protein PG996_006860 [Apiospora saccharicola]|uniref:Uncharacterized protein n=1 Tax=Apiospora saccharicola TaxID=335842 RepID=A0ABR1V9A3_9PEZI
MTWIICVVNDVQDYERDVLGGETNNLVRGLASSSQQVVDAAYMALRAVEAACTHEDFDLVDAFVGSYAYFIMTWRYNAAKQFKLYEAAPIRDRQYGNPVEAAELEALLEENYPVPPRSEKDNSYGELFDRVASTTRECYGGCTCPVTPDCKPRGHETWAMLKQALDEGDNDDLEEQMHVEFSYLSNGASRGDIRCECGLDLLCYEGFVRFCHPDTGLVARMHYRTSTSNGNCLAE